VVTKDDAAQRPAIPYLTMNRYASPPRMPTAGEPPSGVVTLICAGNCLGANVVLAGEVASAPITVTAQRVRRNRALIVITVAGRVWSETLDKGLDETKHGHRDLYNFIDNPVIVRRLFSTSAERWKIYSP
jgi:hypothetical protein